MKIIGERAFEGCEVLSMVQAPASVAEIDWHPSTDFNNLIIHAYKNSYAIKFAKEKSIKNVEL